MINIISTTGLAVFTGFTGLFSLGHAAFMAVGAYTSAILTYFVKAPYPVALLTGVLASSVLAVLVGYPTLRTRLRGDYFAIATIGMGEATRVILENLKITQGARGLPGISQYTTLPVAGAAAAIVLVLARNMLASVYGRNAVSVREDAVAAEMSGIHLLRTRMISLVFSAGCAGLAGGLYAHYLAFIQPVMFTMVQSTQITAAVVCGGTGSLTGPALAAFVFTVAPELLRAAQMWRLVIYGLMLVLIMVFRPQGLMGYRDLSWQGLCSLAARLRKGVRHAKG
ncbi:MAG: branched-chain amino acid ABC transporter permease [Firmicutes bacterium]|nr:branched-chain amino acid ABC transporter permease [Candidatus Fermentithermobacillaceae bacterium]